VLDVLEALAGFANGFSGVGRLSLARYDAFEEGALELPTISGPV
jgi:hypothetical protein